jgi:hypothetical protein
MKKSEVSTEGEKGRNLLCFIIYVIENEKNELEKLYFYIFIETLFISCILSTFQRKN